MSDLTDRLQSLLEDGLGLTDGQHDTIVEAIDELEQLRAENERLEKVYALTNDTLMEMKATLDAVRALIKTWSEEQANYPPLEYAAAAAVRCCARELEALVGSDTDAV